MTPLEMRRQFLDDPQRPVYHFLAPANFMGDPNGAMMWQGKYHLFYQYNPDESFNCDERMHWGHARSDDLVHWQDLPIAIAPEPGKPDGRGCYSGHAVVVDGKPTIFYYGRGGGNCIATSDDDMLTWTKYPGNPIIPHPPKGTAVWRAWDPCAWKEGDTWYSLSGGNINDKDTAFLFESKDFIHWQYLHPLYEPGDETDCSVPSFVPFATDRYLLTFASHPRGAQYYIGTYKDHRFYPEIHGRFTFDQCNLECGNFYAPITMADDHGRLLMYGWITDGLSEAGQRQLGWSGVMCLPRVLSPADDGTLRIEPAPELQQLRHEHRQLTNQSIPAGGAVALKEIAGDCLELEIEFEPTAAGEYGLMVRRSPDEREHTRIYYSRDDACLCLDPALAGDNPDMIARNEQRGPLKLADDEPLKLRVFLDHSIIEVYANARQCLTRRIYPTRPDSRTIALFARRGAAVARSLNAWQMTTIWPDVDGSE